MANIDEVFISPRLERRHRLSATPHHHRLVRVPILFQEISQRHAPIKRVDLTLMVMVEVAETPVRRTRTCRVQLGDVLVWHE